MNTLRLRMLAAGLLALAGVFMSYGPILPQPATLAAPAVLHTSTETQPTPAPTPDPYAGLTIADLAARTYGFGELTVERTMAEKAAFTRYLIRYPSEGLNIYGFMDVPTGEGPFPVVLVLHGYVNPASYKTLAYTTRYADALAQAGYITIHPNYRGHPPSDSDGSKNLFRVGFAVDVLNLAALVRQHGGQAGPLQKADPQAIGLLGHSMGGGIALRAAVVDPGIKAAVLYGAMSGDEKSNAERLMIWSGGQRGKEELAAPVAVLDQVSPVKHLDRIQAAVSIHHGALDGTVPPEWSSDLFGRLQGLGKPAEYFDYPDQPHTFKGAGDQLFIQRSTEFFDRELKGKR